MDIIVGSITPLGSPVTKPASSGSLIEAELLNMRQPRQRIAGPSGQERRRQFRQDPPKGMVLTLLIPDGTILPKDLDVKKYKVLLRVMKK